MLKAQNILPITTNNKDNFMLYQYKLIKLYGLGSQKKKGIRMKEIGLYYCVIRLIQLPRH